MALSFPIPQVDEREGPMVLTKQPRQRQIERSMSKSICTFNGSKGNVSPTYHESPLERDFCYYLEFDKSVLCYEAQPLGLIYWNPVKQKECQYTPDFKVRFIDHRECYYEIKYKSDISRSSDFEHIFEWAKTEAQRQGSVLELITDEFISKKYTFQNLVLLYRYANIELDHHYVLWVKERLRISKHSPLIDLINSSSESTSQKEQLYKLIWSQELSACLSDELIGMNTIVSLGEDVVR